MGFLQEENYCSEQISSPLNTIYTSAPSTLFSFYPPHLAKSKNQARTYFISLLQ